MFLKHILTIFKRDLLLLHAEVKLYKNEELLWKTIPGISNSGGHLTLHIIGNLRHFIGHILGGTGYVRNREQEFSGAQTGIAQLEELISLCREEIITALTNLSPDILLKDFPVEIKEVDKNTQFVLMHLSTHLSYHLGQINYHRRIISALHSES